ncbi:MAG TPA: fasciclin domain-containing protein, partial [Bacteroidales bacterium]|nr:fasciclin domain-containing protein [Bacteroidales bacterium]
MKYRAGILGILIALLITTGCKKEWDQYYDSNPPTVDENVWNAIKQDPELSNFVKYMEQKQFDTLFAYNNTYTLFIPVNESFTGLTDADSITASVLDYHISQSLIQSNSIKGNTKIQTLSDKFALLQNDANKLQFDGIDLKDESQLYKNGKFYKMTSVGFPLPNIYEYYAVHNPVFKKYVDSQDSIIVDKERSRPIGFDENGNTIYDTVPIIYNKFESEYFPIREEFRHKSATVVFPNADNYNNALTQMAQALGSVYKDYKDIPLDWQNEKLIPYLLEHGVFENMVERSVFLTPTRGDTVKMKNILGDSVVIDYVPGQKVLCSNGYVYDYSDFEVPDTLWSSSVPFEGESLVYQTGINKFGWRDGVKVSSSTSVKPTAQKVINASNDSVLSVLFPLKYTGTFSLEFTVKDLFPRKYLMK